MQARNSKTMPSSPGTGRRPAAPYSKGDATAEKILDAAFKSIALHGCGAVTLRGIAEEAGVALSQLSYYYGNKDSLFAAVATHMHAGYVADLQERLQKADSLEDQMVAFVDHNEAALRTNPDIFRNYLEFSTLAMTSAEFQDKIADLTTEVIAVMERHAARTHPEEKVGDTFSVEEAARYTLSATLGTALQHFIMPDKHAVLRAFDAVRATVRQRIAADRRGRGAHKTKAEG
ncbi:TetR/AcrR family transcriptional regulator [Rhizobium binxianense]